MRIAIFSLIEWDFVNQRPQAFARELARRGHEVLYVEPAALADDVDAWLAERREGRIGVYPAEPGIRVAEGTMIPPRDSCRHLYPHNRELAYATARWLAGFDLDFALLLAPEYGPAVAELGLPCAYDHVDETQYMDGVDTAAYVQAMEALKAVTAFNIYIQEPAAERDPKGFFLPNGVETEVFFPIARPRLFDGVVLSTIAKWFDLDSLLRAEARILLIGPMDHDQGDNRQRFFAARRPNLHWIPQVDKPTANLWLSTAHVGIVPFRLDHPVVPYAMPIKILEYFMAGLPVVTYRSEGIERFYGDRVTYYAADGRGDPCLDEAIARARERGTAHRDFALQFTWDRLVARLDARISEAVRAAGPRPRQTLVPVGAPSAPTAGRARAAPAAGGGPPTDGGESVRRYVARLQHQLQLRTSWAINLDREVRERTEWAQRLQRERDEMADWARRLQEELAARTRWALRLKDELERRTGQPVEAPPFAEVAAPEAPSSPPWEAAGRAALEELAFIRRQWWFRLFSPGWRGWLRRLWRRGRPENSTAPSPPA